MRSIHSSRMKIDNVRATFLANMSVKIIYGVPSPHMRQATCLSFYHLAGVITGSGQVSCVTPEESVFHTHLSLQSANDSFTSSCPSVK